MLKGASGLIAVVIAVVILLCLPVPGAADVYRTFEYFEGLPADYVPAGGQGLNFRESRANSPTHT